MLKRGDNLLNNNNARKIKSSIKFVKTSKEGSQSNIIIDAINLHITNLNESKMLHYVYDFLVTNHEEFEIAPHIYCRALIDEQAIENSENDTKIKYIICLFSYELELVYIREFVEKIKKRYLYEQNNNSIFPHICFICTI